VFGVGAPRHSRQMRRIHFGGARSVCTNAEVALAGELGPRSPTQHLIMMSAENYLSVGGLRERLCKLGILFGLLLGE
jgi:hypothetical protein